MAKIEIQNMATYEVMYCTGKSKSSNKSIGRKKIIQACYLCSSTLSDFLINDVIYNSKSDRFSFSTFSVKIRQM